MIGSVSCRTCTSSDCRWPHASCLQHRSSGVGDVLDLRSARLQWHRVLPIARGASFKGSSLMPTRTRSQSTTRRCKLGAARSRLSSPSREKRGEQESSASGRDTHTHFSSDRGHGQTLITEIQDALRVNLIPRWTSATHRHTGPMQPDCHCAVVDPKLGTDPAERPAGRVELDSSVYIHGRTLVSAKAVN
jgi:hypothetical protein